MMVVRQKHVIIQYYIVTCNISSKLTYESDVV
jgi:hypothetical protein